MSDVGAPMILRCRYYLGRVERGAGDEYAVLSTDGLCGEGMRAALTPDGAEHDASIVVSSPYHYWVVWTLGSGRHERALG